MNLRSSFLLASAALVGSASLAMAEPPRPPQTIADALPPYELVTIIRSTGLVPVSRPVRRGHLYEIQAIDPYDMNVRVLADARTGRIVSVEDASFAAAYAGAPGLVPGPYGRPSSRLGWSYGEPPPPLPPRAIPGTRANHVAPMPRARSETPALPAQIAAKPAELTGATPAAKPPEAPAAKPAGTAALPPVQPLE